MIPTITNHQYQQHEQNKHVAEKIQLVSFSSFHPFPISIPMIPSSVTIDIAATIT